MTLAPERKADVPQSTFAHVRPRELVRVAGRVLYVEVSPADRAAQLTLRLTDGTGNLDCVFMGRRSIAGLEPGVTVCVEGRVAQGDDAPVLYNPRYELCRATA